MKDNQKLLVMCGLRRGRMIGFDSVPNRSTTSYICKYTVRTKFKLILVVFVAAKASDVFFFALPTKDGYFRNKPILQKSARNHGLFTFFDYVIQYLIAVFYS